MKTKFYADWKAVLVLAGLPFVAAALQGPADDPQSGQVVPVVTAEPPQLATDPAVPVAATNAQPSGPTLPGLQFYGGTAEIVKLAQSGVGDSVMLSYISNTPARFSLGSDQIIYLNDLGVSPSVVTAMIQHDSALDVAGVVTPPTNALPPMMSVPPPDQTGVPVYPPDQTSDTSVPPPWDYTEYNPYPPADFSTPDDTAYFHDSLAPYGSWLFVPGYGLCWQPVVWLHNHDWRPYCDRGRWLSTDCGWYWQSDYSWGWAAFHYGRWFHDSNHGWCWLPNRTWSPAWVSWRNSAQYAGWAPLPPSAGFAHGAGLTYQGRAVNANFEFGLRRGQYTFVPTERMADYAPARYRVTGAQAVGAYNQTMLANHFSTENHHVVVHSVDPAQVEARSGSPLRRAVVHDLAGGVKNGPAQADRLDKRGDSLVVYRPQLPAAPGHGPNTFTTGNGGPAPTRRFATTAKPGVPATSPVVNAPAPAGRVASGTVTAASSNPDTRSHVQVYVRHDAPSTPETTSPASTRVVGVTAPGTQAGYPRNSLVIMGRQNLTDPRVADRPTTFTVYQRPDVSANGPQVVLGGKNATDPRAAGSPTTFTVNQRPDLSANVAQQGWQGGGTERNWENNSGGQYSPLRGVQPDQSPAPAQAPLLLPSRGQGNSTSYTPRAGNYGQTYSPPSAGRSAPAYNAPSQPLLLPSHSQSAPAPAPAPSYHSSAPAQSSSSSSSHGSSSQSSSSQSSGSSSGHR